MKPNPLASLNHLTVPVVRIAECPEEWVGATSAAPRGGRSAVPGDEIKRARLHRQAPGRSELVHVRRTCVASRKITPAQRRAIFARQYSRLDVQKILTR